MFKLDLMALDSAACGDRNTVSDGCWRGRAVREELTWQLVAAGAPEGDLDTQLSALLASHKAMQEAGEELPEGFVLPTGDATGAAHVVLDRVKPTIARLRRERDTVEAFRQAEVVKREGAEAALAEVQRERDEAKEAILQMGEVLTGEIMPALQGALDPATVTKGREVAALIAAARTSPSVNATTKPTLPPDVTIAAAVCKCITVTPESIKVTVGPVKELLRELGFAEPAPLTISLDLDGARPIHATSDSASIGIGDPPPKPPPPPPSAMVPSDDDWRNWVRDAFGTINTPGASSEDRRKAELLLAKAPQHIIKEFSS